MNTAIKLMNTLAILRGTFGNFRPPSMTSSACINLHINLLLLRTRAIWEHYKINEHPRNPSGYFQELSTAIDDFFGLHQSSCKLTITSNARSLWILKKLMNTLAMLRGTFSNFRPLSMTCWACVNLHIKLLLLRMCAICKHYKINEHPHHPSGYFR